MHPLLPRHLILPFNADAQRHLTHIYVLNLHILKRDFLLQPPTLPKPPCFVLIFTCYSCRTSINIKVRPIKCCPAWNFTVKRYGPPVSHIDTDRLIYATAPAVSRSRTTGGYCIRSRDREHGKERSEEKEGWETRSMECVRACRNADDGQECWKAASDKNLSCNDSSVSMCPLRDDGSVLLLLGDLSLQWRNHQLRLVGLSEHTVKVRPNKHGPQAYFGANVLCIKSRYLNKRKATSN